MRAIDLSRDLYSRPALSGKNVNQRPLKFHEEAAGEKISDNKRNTSAGGSHRPADLMAVPGEQRRQTFRHVITRKLHEKGRNPRVSIPRYSSPISDSASNDLFGFIGQLLLRLLKKSRRPGAPSRPPARLIFGRGTRDRASVASCSSPPPSPPPGSDEITRGQKSLTDRHDRGPNYYYGKNEAAGSSVPLSL